MSLGASYDGDGTRVSKSDFWAGAHNSSWGAGGVVHDSSGSGTVYTPGFAQRQGSIDRFAHEDWLGSTRYLSDYARNAFPSAGCFGASVGAAGTLGRTEARSRSLGARFLTRDPAATSAGSASMPMR